MSKLHNRVKTLEKQSGESVTKNYLCTIHPDDVEYKVDSMDGKGESFTFKTREAMTAYFEQRNDIELLLIEIVYASQDEQLAKPN